MFLGNRMVDVAHVSRVPYASYRVERRESLTIRDPGLLTDRELPERSK